MKKVDVLIMGGGPAGSTAATLIKKYSPHLRVALLEREHFPRHHVGESLLAGSTPILKEMEVYDAVKRFGFPEKLGATYVWGQDGSTWGFEFQEIDGQLRNKGITLPPEFFEGWQVTRGDYDKILLDHAAACGAEVIQGARVTRLRLEDAMKRGVSYVHDGVEKDLAAEFVLDCTGQHGLISSKKGLRDFDPSMNNLAIYGYWVGAKWRFEYAGFPNLTRIFIASTPHGWLWYIPVRRDVISVGFVTHRKMASGGQDLNSQYLAEIAACPEIAEMLSSAQLTRLDAQQKGDLYTARDWSYTCRQMAGDGWALAGDAAGFVDPILSSGCLLAHEHGKKAAYTINTVFELSSDRAHRALWQFYEGSYRTVLGAYRKMANFWYANNFSTDNWWWEARRVLARGNEGSDLNSRDSFMRVASGYANRTESISLFGSYTFEDAGEIANQFFGQTETPSARKTPDQAPRALRRDDVVKLGDETKITTGLFYFRGSVNRTRRLLNASTQEYIDLFPHEFAWAERLRDGCRLADFTDDLTAGKRNISQLVEQLRNIGSVTTLAATPG